MISYTESVGPFLIFFFSIKRQEDRNERKTQVPWWSMAGQWSQGAGLPVDGPVCLACSSPHLDRGRSSPGFRWTCTSASPSYVCQVTEMRDSW